MNPLVPDSLWSVQQVAWLQAMGHIVYLDSASAAGPLAADAVVTAPPQPRACPVVPEAARMAPPRNAPKPLAERVPAIVSGEAGLHRSRVGLPDRLQIALLRACGCNPADPQIQQLMASWPLSQLRASPAAKRALWPHLRALRRSSGMM